ncbi:MAG: AAA family ATPase [Verrucomicrobiota bacterium]
MSKLLPVPDLKATTTEPPPAPPLPDVVDASALVADTTPAPDEVVCGVLHRGAKMVVGGSSKTNKTWCLTDLAIAVSHNEPWLNFKTRPGLVLFVNLEIQPYFFARRIEAIASAKNIPVRSGVLDVLNLRGHCASFDELLPRISERAKQRGYVLIVLDPIYKLMAGRDENSAGDIGEVMHGIESLAVQTGAAVAFAAHFSKGNQAAKESIDRISGSGVFARDPDSILTLTRHQEADSFTIDCVLRNHPPVAPFVATWMFPLMRVNDSLNPADLHQAQTGRKAIYNPQMILDNWPKRKKQTTAGALKEAVCSATGMSRAKFYELLRELVNQGQLNRDDKERYSISLESPESHKKDLKDQ